MIKPEINYLSCDQNLHRRNCLLNILMVDEKYYSEVELKFKIIM